MSLLFGGGRWIRLSADRPGRGSDVPPARHSLPLPSKSIFSYQTKETSFRMSLLFGGGRWIRTTEGIASRFTVCPLWPLGNSPIFFCHRWSWWTDSNPRPADYKSAALPTELHQHRTGLINIAKKPVFVNTLFQNFSFIFLSFLRHTNSLKIRNVYDKITGLINGEWR